MNFVDIVFASFLANNLLFFHYFGLGEFLGGPGGASLGKRIGVLSALLLVSTLMFWSGDHFVLGPFHLEGLRTLLVFLVLAVVILTYSALLGPKPRTWPPARDFLVHSFLVGGVFLVGSSNGEVLAVLVSALAVVLGYGGALVILAAVFGRLSRERIPAFLQGLPLQLMTLGLVWLVLQGLGFAFSGKLS